MSSSNIPFTFIVYHTAVSDEGIEAIATIYEENPTVNWKQRWLDFKKNFFPHVDAYIELFFQSTRLTHPNCRCVLLTDLNTPFNLSKEIEIIRYPLNPDKPAYMRLLAQMRYLETASNDKEHLFLDYDMLVQKNLSSLCAADFDVGLVYQSQGFRIEGSFLLVRRSKQEKGIQFLKKVEETFKAHSASHEAWGGIEASLNRLISIKPRHLEERVSLSLDEIALQLFPGDLYSYPFYQNDLLLGIEYLPQQAILHFRGDIKAKMLEYWKLYASKSNE